MLCLFLFHIDYTIYANHVIFGYLVLTVFSLRTFLREVKVVQSCINNE